MKQTVLPIRFTLTVVAVLGLFAAPAQAQWHYYYFDEPQPLELDVSRVVVFESEGIAAGSVSKALSRHGIAEADVRQSAVPHMAFAGTPASVRTENGVQALVKDIADAGEVGFVSPVFQDQRGDTLMITQYLHVRFHEHISSELAEAILAEAGAGLIVERDWARMKGTYRLRSSSRNGFEVLEAANALAQRPEVRFAEPDILARVRTSLIPDDPYFPDTWGIHNTGQSGGTVDMDMDGPEAWDITTGHPAIIVVVMDTGIQQDHPDLNQVPGQDFTGQGAPGGGPYNQCDNHGTAVGGCVSAIINNATGVVGIAPDCVVASARVFVSEVVNPCSIYGSVAVSWVVNALDWAESRGALVTNASIGMPYSSSINDKYAWTKSEGIVHFSSSGNGGGGTVGYPANLPSVNAVGSLNRYGNRASYSQYGAALAFSAPGVSIWTTDRTGPAGYASAGYTLFGGTSAASPYAAGVAALIRAFNPSLSPEDVEGYMQLGCKDLGDPGWDQNFGWGFVSAHDSLLLAPSPVPICEVDKLVASDAALDAQFGHAVATGDSIVAVGARNDPCAGGGYECGSSYVYRWTGNSFTEEQKLVASDAGVGDRFGSSVSVSRETVVVGAPLDDGATEADAGSAYVFRWGGSVWSEETPKLVSPVAEANAQFGSSVALDGAVALIGAKNEGNTGGLDGPGAAYVFRHDGGNWVNEDRLTATDAASGDQFGGSVSLRGDAAVAGAAYADCGGGGADCGAAYVYRNGGGLWVEEQKVVASDATAGDRFGQSVSVRGDLLIVGAPGADCDAGADCGAAYIYRWDGNTWDEQIKITDPDAAAGDSFGSSVAVYGEVMMVGAPSADCGAGVNCGKAYMVRPVFGLWRIEDTLTPADAAADDTLGSSVALGSVVGVAGASLHDSLTIADSGAAYTYSFPWDCNDTNVFDLCDILDGTSDDLDSDGKPDECVTPDAPTTPDGEAGVEKPRYISLVAGTPGVHTALRVTLTDLPDDFAAYEGTQMWVGEPLEICENSGQDLPENAPGGECGVAWIGGPVLSMWSANLEPERYCHDFGSLDSLHVTDCEIVPEATYTVDAMNCTVDPENEEYYSEPLAISTSSWGNICGFYDTENERWSAPDTNVDIVFDVTACVDKFKNLFAAPLKPRADLDPNVPDWKINMASDVTRILDAFGGDPYPFSGPGTCP